MKKDSLSCRYVKVSDMKKRLICMVLAFIIGFIGCYSVFRYIKHENRQKQDILRLQSSIDNLQNELDNQVQQVKELAKNSPIYWLDNGVNYLAIGNSITTHGLADYWWNDGVGMAASSEEHDFVHLVSKWLQEIDNKPVKTYAYNFYTWEAQATDRAETLQLLDYYLSDKIDLITIQLGENVTDISNYKEDCQEMYRYIMQKAPNAKIIVIDDFWENSDKSLLKEEAAKVCDVNFVSLNEIKGNSEYQAGMGTAVKDKDGNEHIINHSGVAKHPGDKGMAYIAESIERVYKDNQ